MVDDGGYGFDHDESITAFDSDDSDTSDFLPDFEWSRLAGDFPGKWFRYTPDTETFVPLARSFICAVEKMPALRRLDIHFGGSSKETRAPLDMSYFAPGEVNRGASHVNGRKAFDEENANRPRWFLCGGRKFDKQWKMPQQLEREFKGKSVSGVVHIATN
ncbi:F-box domain-containin cyclin-like protein [Colletotrichum tofieldiae]|nr:F-box domain-containin cyclin-like protein [Colletotrichum tofieldiae]